MLQHFDSLGRLGGVRTVATVRAEGHQEFEAWVRERGEVLQRFALLVCGSRTEAQDLVQDALARA